MRATDEGFITEVIPGSQAATHGVLPLWDICEVNGEPFTGSLLSECRRGSKCFTITVRNRDTPSFDDFGLTPQEAPHLRLPPDWVEVIPPGWGVQGREYFKNKKTGQCCEHTPLPREHYPMNRSAHCHARGRALKAIVLACENIDSSSSPFGSDKPTITRFLRDFVHDTHAPMRLLAIQALGGLKKSKDFDVLRTLASRTNDDSIAVLDAVIVALEQRLQRVGSNTGGFGWVHDLIKKHKSVLKVRAEQFPQGYSFQVDVPAFARGLLAAARAVREEDDNSDD
eukprot:gnl/TRDRNA2_/TRDRNA2_121615_c2_seq1.p1 gnl/TRDRNA2_/TRDRNA2_121615_c2~~gnl/TRDRNA2_/TRDRNA2_121615_c2_seq1.p1  ORF type:complete len:322 (-),score=23.56 gnl/TRDRNA2_/TRDRNA2_121615_c2_seq1:125-973(-)